MKKNDIIVLMVAAFISAVLSILLSNALISSPKNRDETAEVVEPIVADFPEADDRYFNEDSLNPTRLIRIGENSNESPFNTE